VWALIPQASSAPPAEAAALERSWDFTKASTGQKVGAIALGAVNLVGVAFLASLLANPTYQYRLAATSLAFVPGIFPWLQVTSFPQYTFLGTSHLAGVTEARCMQLMVDFRRPCVGRIFVAHCRAAITRAMVMWKLDT
jgi:hypothetical protein